MNPAFGFLVILTVFVVWLLLKPVWSRFGGWLYDQTEEISEVLKEETEISKDTKGDNENERTAECEEEN